MANENKQTSLIKSVYNTIRSLIPKSQLKGAVVPKSDKAGIYGVVFRNVAWPKLQAKQTEIANLLKDTDWQFSMVLSLKDDPESMATDKAGKRLKNSFCYIGKDFREVVDIDFSTEDIVL